MFKKRQSFKMVFAKCKFTVWQIRITALPVLGCPFLFIYLPPTQLFVTQQPIVPQKWQTTFLKAHQVEITKMFLTNFCLNSVQYFNADKEILSTRSLNFVCFLFWPTDCTLLSPWGIKKIVLFDFFFYFPERPTALDALVKVSINTELKNHGLIKTQ